MQAAQPDAGAAEPDADAAQPDWVAGIIADVDSALIPTFFLSSNLLILTFILSLRGTYRPRRRCSRRVRRFHYNLPQPPRYSRTELWRPSRSTTRGLQVRGGRRDGLASVAPSQVPPS